MFSGRTFTIRELTLCSSGPHCFPSQRRHTGRMGRETHRSVDERSIRSQWRSNSDISKHPGDKYNVFSRNAEETLSTSIFASGIHDLLEQRPRYRMYYEVSSYKPNVQQIFESSSLPDRERVPCAAGLYDCPRHSTETSIDFILSIRPPLTGFQERNVKAYKVNTTSDSHHTQFSKYKIVITKKPKDSSVK